MGWAGREHFGRTVGKAQMLNIGLQRFGWVVSRGFPVWRRDVDDGLAVLYALLLFAKPC